MSLTNEQIDQINRVYQERQLNSSTLLNKRKEEIFSLLPEYKELHDLIISTCMAYSRALILKKQDQKDSLDAMHRELLDLRMKKNQLLTAAGYPHDYLEMTYVCSLCKDTGYIDNEKCSCRVQMELEYLYSASHLEQILSQNNFSLLSYDYYRGEELEEFSNNLIVIKDFINNFNKHYDNLLFYGKVGTGKSFLSGCIAKELLDQNYSIAYFSAIQLFQSISTCLYAKDKSQLTQLMDYIYHCDLLIIDDLGSELITEFTRSQLFSILTEREILQKPILISTNLTTEPLRTSYGERIFSRITGNFQMLHFEAKDIRLQKKLDQTDSF